MKRVFQIAVLVGFLAFAAIQFVRPEFKNPPIDKALRVDSILVVPAGVSAVMKRSCNDCHSNETVYPFYSNVAPISWSLADHIRVGRSELNFSEWGSYTKSRQRRKLKQMCREVEAGTMPHNQYLWIHWDAALTTADKKALCDWSESARELLANPQSGN